MRVLHLYKTYYPDTMGGVEQAIFQICQSCKIHGIDSEVLTLSPNPSPRHLPIGSHWVHRSQETLNIASTGFSHRVFYKFRRLAEQCDIIHYHFPWPFMDLLHFAANIKKPSIVSYHSDIVRQKTLLQLYQPLMHRFLTAADMIVAASPNYLASSKILHRYQHKTRIIPYGLDRSSYPEANQETLQHWHSRYPQGFFLFVGVMRYYKGLHILLEACKNRNYPVVIVGQGPMEKKLRQQCNELQLSNVHFLGPLPDGDKTALLQLCRAVVFPSHLRSEAFGISLLEGAMFGKPMISSEIGTGTTYINSHAHTGFVVPPRDASALQAAMDTLWHDDALAQRMGTAAAERYQQLFTAERMGKMMSHAYHDLLEQAYPTGPTVPA